ncbi:hypothetical protein AEAC466_01420 [Asticcacaulis sp. AC466]|uniref:glycosyltransferase family 4 protein n=1 Tax=Asticcacaulis sp. AC466 TaxID=1282362 RepID=UPI0003C3B719|nr:glycosyltransferase family 4 protein [Asticcacaulis sp. AC466]ESQ85865.1 hypothetical protein AEAC466_01420 [Asticcacaulis sp. AC466]
MKIAIVLPPVYAFCALYPHSIETVIRTLAAGLPAEDQLLVICDTGAKARCNIPVVEVANSWHRSRDIIAALRAYDPDIIEFHQSAAILRPVAKAFRDRATVFYRHNYVKPPKNRIDAWRVTRRLRYFKTLVFVSDDTREDFLSHFRGLADKSVTIHNPIQIDQWSGNPDDKDRTILFCARTVPEKGLSPMIDGLLDLLPRYPQWRGVLLLGDFAAGGAWAGAQVARLAPIADQVSILKNQSLEDVRHHTQRAAIAVIPSMWREPFGLTALEAHAAGCAVVSSGSGGLREVSGPHAVFLDEVSGSAIAAAVASLIDAPDERKALARNGQAHVRHAHALPTRMAQIADVRRRMTVNR